MLITQGIQFCIGKTILSITIIGSNIFFFIKRNTTRKKKGSGLAVADREGIYYFIFLNGR
jgi:hypothetical protein